MRCFHALERTRTPEKDIHLKIWVYFGLRKGMRIVTVTLSDLSQMTTGPICVRDH
jgi:hypothetical protein